MTEAELEHFVRHYERLTRHMLTTMPDYADAVIDIDENHRMTAITHLGAKALPSQHCLTAYRPRDRTRAGRG